MRSKIFVEVTARFDTDGSLTPLDLVWEDGRRYPVDRVIEAVPEVVDKVTEFIEKQQEKKAQEDELA